MWWARGCPQTLPEAPLPSPLLPYRGAELLKLKPAEPRDPSFPSPVHHSWVFPDLWCKRWELGKCVKTRRGEKNHWSSQFPGHLPVNFLAIRSMHFILFFFFNFACLSLVYLPVFREGVRKCRHKREREQGEGQTERGRERENPKQAPHCQCGVRCGARTHEPRDGDLSGIQESDA